MSIRTIGKQLNTADIAGNIVSQQFTLTFDTKLVGVHTGIIIYGNPSFTDFGISIYFDNGGLIETSSLLSKAQIHTQDHALKFVGLELSGKIYEAGVTYHAVPYISGYTGTDSSHIAWRQSYPDPQFRSGLTSILNASQADNHPIDIVFIGDEVE